METVFDYGYAGKDEDIARITAVHKNRFAIVTIHGHGFARLKTSAYQQEAPENIPCVGDYVRIQYNPMGDSPILQTLARKSVLIRRASSPSGGEQVLAANFDVIGIVTSLNQDLNRNRLIRYLTLARQSGAEPLLILTKADLVDEETARRAAQDLEDLQVKTLCLSSLTGEGIQALVPYLAPGKTILFTGSSGVGKSSLLNALLGEERMRVNAIREDDAKGRHTTTHRELLRLHTGALVIDSPGIRQVGLWDAAEGLSEVYEDIESLIAQCRFSDCTHTKEPGCRIREALASGELAPKRWKQYQKLDEENQATRRAKRIQEIARFRKQRSRAERKGRPLLAPHKKP